jgi:hypothetical protein
MISDYYNSFDATESKLRAIKKISSKILASNINPIEKQDYDPTSINMYDLIIKNKNKLENALEDDPIFDARQSALAEEEANTLKEVDGKKFKKGTSLKSILSMVFKMVPIGLKVLSRAPLLFKGMADIIQGTAIGIANLAQVSAITLKDTFLFGYQGFTYLFKSVICSVENLSVFHKCFLFYVIDLILLVIYLTIFSLLFLADVIIMSKKLFGFTFVDVFLKLLATIESVDHTLYKFSGIHIAHYPDSIIKMCYTCSQKMNTKEVRQTGSKWLSDFTELFPRKMRSSIQKLSSGIKQIGSVFDLK